MSTIITPIIMPFASGRTSGTLPNVIPAVEPHSSIDNVANQTTGFPVLQATSLGGGGIPVQEGEINGVLNFYTNLLFQMGQGYQFTFDVTLSDKISGYPQGAILWCASNKTYQLSLKNNNTANFITTPSFINDGVNWQNLNNAGEFPDITDNVTTGSVTIGGKVVGGTQTLKTIDTNGRKAVSTVFGNAGGAQIGHLIENEDGTVNNGIGIGVGQFPVVVAHDFTSINRVANGLVISSDFSSYYDESELCGYIKLPAGVNGGIQKSIIIQYGFRDISVNDVVHFTFPITFPHDVISITSGEGNENQENYTLVSRIGSTSNSGFNRYYDNWGGADVLGIKFHWIAIGF